MVEAMKNSTEHLTPKQRGHAAQPSEKKKKPQRVLFFLDIKSRGSYGSTYDESRRRLGITSECSTRITELTDLGVIRESGVRSTAHDEDATVYVAVEGKTEEDASKRPPARVSEAVKLQKQLQKLSDTNSEMNDVLESIRVTAKECFDMKEPSRRISKRTAAWLIEIIDDTCKHAKIS